MTNRTLDELALSIDKWGSIRGLNASTPIKALEKVEEEVSEIEDAIHNCDEDALIDAIGDTFVTLVNLCKAAKLDITDCVNTSYKVIEKRKGLLQNGLFVRYGKLSKEEQELCDELQGNPGEEYFTMDLNELNESMFVTKD